MSEDKKYWEGFDYALSLLEEMYGKTNFLHPYNIADCVKAKVNRLPQEQIMVSISSASPVSDAVKFAEWKDNNYFTIVIGDKNFYLLKKTRKIEDYLSLHQVYQIFKQQSSITNVQEQDEQDTWELFFEDYQMYAEAEKRLGNNVSIGEFYSENKLKYTITKKQ